MYEDSTIPSDAAGGYTVIGRVTDGLDALRGDITDQGVADDATDGAPVRPVSITSFVVE